MAIQPTKFAIWRLSINLALVVAASAGTSVFAIQAARGRDWSVAVGWTLLLLLFGLRLTVTFAVLLLRALRMKRDSSVAGPESDGV